MRQLVSYIEDRIDEINQWMEQPLSEKTRLKQALKAVEQENRSLRRDVEELSQWVQTKRNQAEDTYEALEDLHALYNDLLIDMANVAWGLEQSKSANYHKIAAKIRTVLDQY